MSAPTALLIIAGLLAFFFIPTIVAYNRGHRNTLAIFIVNLLTGLSGIGWVVALVWSVLNTNNK